MVPGERAVLLGGVGVVAGAHELAVHAVDAAAVREHDVADVALVEQLCVHHRPAWH